MSGGSDGVVQKHFVLDSAAGECIVRVIFRQCGGTLLGVMFETNRGSAGDYLLMEHHGWQVKDGFVKHDEQINWVYEASPGSAIVGYNVEAGPRRGRGGHATGWY